MELSLSELASRLGLAPPEGGSAAADPTIRGAAGFDDAGPGEITFADDPRLLKRLDELTAAAVILAPGHDAPVPVLRADDPRAVFADVLGVFAPPLEAALPSGIHPSAHVDPDAELGDEVAIGPGSVVGPGVRIGSRTRLGAHVVLEADVTIGADCCLYHQVVVRERCRLGDRVTIHAGVVVGTDGFGYHPGVSGLVKIPQIGIVVLEDDVEIGANACIDRATTGVTRIGAGTKIDNLVQIAHNVSVGRSSAISAQSGVSGSCDIGDGVTLGGQVGVGDHLSLGDGVRVAGQSGVTRDVAPGETVFGCPAVEFQRGYRLVAHYHRLPELFRRVVELERTLSDGDATEENDC